MGYAGRHLEYRYGISQGLLSVPRRDRHEFVGVVEEGSAGLVGERVVGEINAACGACTSCRSGRATYCPTRQPYWALSGGTVRLPNIWCCRKKILHQVPKEIDTAAATFVEPLAAALIQQEVTIRPDDGVLLLGDGKLGQLTRRPWP